MKPLVSVIITTRNEEGNVRLCLESIRKQTYKPIECIIVDNSSSDHTKEVAQAFGAKVFDKGPERSVQRNFGAKNSKGIYLLFLDADMMLTENVVEECLKAVENNKYLGVVIPEHSIGQGFWAKCKSLERTYYLGLSWNTGARFFPKDLFIKIGGYDEKNTGTEDFDLPQRIESKFGSTSIGHVSSSIYHNEGRLRLINTCKKKYYYAKNLYRYRQSRINREKFAIQANIFERYKLYFSRPYLLFKNPVIGIGMLFMKTCEFISGGIGYIVGITGMRV